MESDNISASAQLQEVDSPPEEPAIDLDAPELYLNRELTWLNFAKRVLNEAQDERNPLLERVKFLGIVGSILDEFFMKRIGGLKQQVAAGVHDLTIDGRTPAQQIAECHEVIRKLNEEQRLLWFDLRRELADIRVNVVNHQELSAVDQEWVRDYYIDNIFPLVTPQAMDPAHPFPFVSNLSVNLLVSLHYPKDPTPLLARVKVPLGSGVKRFIKVGDENTFVPVEQVMANNLDLLFPEMTIDRCELFRVTRNADVEQDEEEADDLVALIGKPNIFHAIRERGSILLQHPYESFATSVERFIREASEDPKVRAIKMTLYRTSSESRIIQHLVNAALNGKQVAVAVELKARFDEATNIRWANQLEQAGIHVAYGVLGLKTHCKVTLVVRQDHSGLRRYCHFGTGNYHEETAKLYSDLGVLTADPEIGKDATELFNYLTTGYRPKRKYRKLLPAPKLLRKALLAKIAREIKHAQDGKAALIQIKVNALEDVDVTRALYEASIAGVHVDLIVRDTCRIRPGLPIVSENIRVISIVGRFLEHARIFHFGNDGDDEYYIGSADCMKRNLTSRVEVLVPIRDEELKREVQTVFDVQLADGRSAWEMKPDGGYVQLQETETGSQAELVRLAEKRHAEATRLRKRKSQHPGPRNE